MKCLRCSHDWMSKVKEPKRCPKCKSPYWNKQRIVIENVDLTKGGHIYLGSEPKGEVHESNYDIKRLEAQIVSLHEEVANKNVEIEILKSERLPPTKVLLGDLEANPIIILPTSLYSNLKNRLILAMRDKLPIKFALKGQDITEIL